MEPKIDIGPYWAAQAPDLLEVSLEDYFDAALTMCEFNYAAQLNYFRDLNYKDIGPWDFWNEYIWCVYTSGFRASVVQKWFKKIVKAYSDWRTASRDKSWNKVSVYNANRAKYRAIVATAYLLTHYEDSKGECWWDSFKQDKLSTPEKMQTLSFIGKITKYHLARNLGQDFVKPDLHLVRLANHFEMPDPESMCEYLSGLSGERLGVVDLILWYAASSWGTLEIEE